MSTDREGALGAREQEVQLGVEPRRRVLVPHRLAHELRRRRHVVRPAGQMGPLNRQVWQILRIVHVSVDFFSDSEFSNKKKQFSIPERRSIYENNNLKNCDRRTE